MINQDELIRYFLLEAEEYVNNLLEGIEELETKGYNKETIEELFRVTHTLKGSASIVKFNKISTLSHRLEDLFESILNKEIEYSQSLVDVIKKVVNMIIVFVNEVSKTNEEKSEIDQTVIKLIDDILDRKEIPAQAVTTQERFEVLPVTNTVRVELSLIEKIFSILGEVLLHRNRITDKGKELSEIVEEISHSGKRLVQEISAFSDRYWLATQDRGEKIVDSFFADFSDLEFDRYDEYHIFLRKIQEITNDITQSISTLFTFSDTLSDNLKSLSKEINQLKDNLVEIRMMPIGKLLHRLAVSIKDVAKEIGKLIEIEIKGSETKIDKLIFDFIYEPLIHILRNAIDHGIEFPDERKQKGKPEKGTIKIETKKEGKYIIIKIQDDGRGIDINKVKETAVAKGLIAPEIASFIPNEEILSYIFAPGFSTSEEVDFESGRGMGLNIVKTAISKLKGTIEVSSELDKETTFKIKIPQSLTVSHLLVFRSSNLEFAVPLNYIAEVLAVEDFPELTKERKIFHKNRSIPVKFFSELFFSSNGKILNKGFIIVFNFSGIRKGLVVEDIIGYEETSINQFGKFLEGLTQYLGYFIGSSGVPRYVIDPLKIFEEEFQFQTVPPKFVDTYVHAGSVLVVDDSISVRKSLQSILEAKKIKVYTAKDGSEALNILENKTVDLVITDLEMPIMHGYELISRIRKEPKFKDLPIIVLTSRGTPKHQEKAYALGADGYIVKPFDEQTISEILSKFDIIKNFY